MGSFEDNNSSQGLARADITFACGKKGDSSADITWFGISINIFSKSEINLTQHTKQENTAELGLVRFFNFRARFDNGKPTKIKAAQRMDADHVIEDSDGLKVTQLVVLNYDKIIPKIRAHKKMLLEIHTNTHLGGAVAEFDLKGSAEKIDAALAKCRQE